MSNDDFIRRYEQRLRDPKVLRARHAKLDRWIEQERRRPPASSSADRDRHNGSSRRKHGSQK
jgi:hypothetical protein